MTERVFVNVPEVPEGEVPAARWKALYESMCKAAKHLEQRVGELTAYLEAERAAKKQWEMDKIRHMEIIQQALTDTNARMNQILEENQQLKQAIVRLKNGHHD